LVYSVKRNLDQILSDMNFPIESAWYVACSRGRERCRRVATVSVLSEYVVFVVVVGCLLQLAALSAPRNASASITAI